MLNRTHDPKAKSWLEVSEDSHFPIQNLPLGNFFRYREEMSDPNASMDVMVHGGVAIGDFVLDLDVLLEAGLLPDLDLEFCYVNSLTELGPVGLSTLRRSVFDLLSKENGLLRDDKKLRKSALVPISEAVLIMPFEIGAFVDFYSGIHHASNVGRMFRPDQPPLLPNYRHLPVGYNGRGSSVVLTGSEIIRPHGQTKAPDAEAPSFGPTKELDFELEMGFFVAEANELGHPIPMGDCEKHIAGLVLVNDWSARDIQRWEYQPLGPFLAKSFGTSISPWLVTLEALEPFRIEGPTQDPTVLPYLKRTGKQHFDIELEVSLQTAKMTSPQVISRSNSQFLYWSMPQQLAHQTINGTNVQVGDLYATGTISGETDDSFGSLLELTWRGTKPISLSETGETRTFLEDDDTLTITGWCQGDGYRVGFGEVSGTIAPVVKL